MGLEMKVLHIEHKTVDWVCLENVCGFYPVYKRFSATHWEKVTSDTSIVSLEALEEIYQAHLKDIEEKKEAVMKVQNVVQKVYVEIDGHNFKYDRYGVEDWWNTNTHGDYSSVTVEKSNKLEEAYQAYLKKLEEKKEAIMKEYNIVKTSTYPKDDGIVCPTCGGTGNLRW